MVRIIINSDDFGLSPSINKAISEAFEQNLITSTTALVNFKEGFQDSLSMVKAGAIPRDSVGIHLNLTEGDPINPNTKTNNKLCENGKFHGRIRNSPVFFVSKEQRNSIYMEIEEQLKKFISSFGFLPSHIDGHHHIHTEWAILSCVIELAKNYKINKIRLTRNIGNGISTSKRIYKAILNYKLRLYGLVTTNYFGDFEDLKYFRPNSGDSLEIMVHAMPSNETGQINDIDHSSLKEKVHQIKKYYSIEYLNYSEFNG